MCVDLSWTVDQADGVWFVSCLLSNPTDVTRRVRLDSCLDGPVLPPRRRGVPEPGWDATGVTLSLESGERRGVGFACPVPPNNTTDEDRIDDEDDADDEDRIDDKNDTTDEDRIDDEDGIDRAITPTDPPVAITDCAPADSDELASSATAAAAVRRLGDHRPPRAVVADVPADAAATTTTASTAATATNETPPTADTALHAMVGGGTDDSRPANGVTGSGAVAASAAWLDAVEERVERAERLTDADLETATTVLERTGGAKAAVDLARRVDADASQLRRLADRASSLAARAAATDVPVEPLESLA